MLTDTELKHLTKLSRIHVSESEADRLKSDLSSILAYVDQLKEVDTQGVEPLYQTTGLLNSFRPDQHQNYFPFTQDLAAKLVGQASEQQDGYVKVRSVLKAK